MANKTIDQLPSKANPTTSDLLVIADVSDNNEMKQITVGSITEDIGSGLINDSSASSTTTYSSTKINTSITAATPDSTTTVKGLTKMSVAPASASSPIAVGDNDGRVPTQGENDALVGTSGTPSSSNKYVTNDDTATTATADKVARRLAGGNITVVTETTGNNTTNAASTAFVQQELSTISPKLQKQSLSTGLANNTGTNLSNATTAYTGCSSSSPIFVLSQVTSAFASIGRYIQDSNGMLKLTHLVTSDVGYNGNSIYGAVLGNYLYVCGSNSGGTAVLHRYSATDLTGSTLMTISGTAITRDVGWFSDGTQLYNVYTNGTARIYTVSGTTATSGSTVSYTSSTAANAYWSDGTSVYAISASTTATYKWALAGGARTTGTTLSSLNYYTVGTTLSTVGGIFKEVGNTTNIITAVDSSASVATIRQITFVPITTF